jgi:hypothetical protein
MSPIWSPGQPIWVTARGNCPQAWTGPSDYAPTHEAQAVTLVSAHWRVHTLWWTGAVVWRDYWELTTDTGLLCVLYHDLCEDTWHLERVYE